MGHAAAAFGISERARARSLLETLAEARAGVRQGVTPIYWPKNANWQTG